MRKLSWLSIATTMALIPGVSVPQDRRCTHPYYTPVQCEVEKRETEEIQKAANVVSRNGTVLRINIQNGKPVELIDTYKQDDKDRIYIFLNHLVDIGFVLVRVEYWEGGTHLLVDLRNGKIEDIQGKPVVSPSKAYLASTNFGGISGYTKTIIKIYKLTPHLKLEWSLEPTWEPSDPKWVTDNGLTLTKNVFNQDLYSKFRDSRDWYTKEKVSIMRKDGQWTVVEK